ncbi:helix-turn-helix domain-containing protein [Gorillibacterium sp. sgz5001074]|uniref:helix-turn-helix domain-containing protein n=1 Tax=Gorillibacterium sp. sgz5001074 TaxID=3446695 RepID=UPI003F6702E7
MKLGDRLKAERERKGWSQIFVAEKVGITNTVLSNYERNYRDPDTDTLRKLADLYEVSIDYLLGREISGVDNDQDIQFIMRARKDLSPKAYERFMKLARDMKKSFEEEDD